MPPCLSPRPVPAGVRTNLLTLQPALRTLTHDYNSLKCQVRDFPLLLQETLRSARAEVSPPYPGPPPWLPPTIQGGDAGGVAEPLLSVRPVCPPPPDQPSHRGGAQHQPGAAAQVPAGAAAPQEVSQRVGAAERCAGGVAGPIVGDCVPEEGGQEGQESIAPLHPSTMVWVLSVPLRRLGQ